MEGNKEMNSYHSSHDVQLLLPVTLLPNYFTVSNSLHITVNKLFHINGLLQTMQNYLQLKNKFASM